VYQMVVEAVITGDSGVLLGRAEAMRCTAVILQ
jgi:hypothetical protein